MSTLLVPRLGVRAGVALAAVALALAACTNSGSPRSTHHGHSNGQSSSASPASSSSGVTQGGTAYLAEGPGDTPVNIWQMSGPQYNTIGNIQLFVDLMYPPLYAMGVGTKAEINYPLSLAQPPVYSNGDTEVTITMRDYRWSDGESVDARDVLFWMHLLKPEKLQWAYYASGEFPDNVVAMSAPNARTVVFRLSHRVNPTWFTDNELTQITPIPLAWDITHFPSGVTATSGTLRPPAPGAALPDATPAGARAVYSFLVKQAKSLSDYSRSPVWSIVDGPWKLTSLTTNGQATFVPNPHYSGAKPHISKLVELPFTSTSSEFNVLRSGQSITVGYLPFQDINQKAALAASHYRVLTSYALADNFFFANFRNPVYGPVFRQLYFRAAFQHLIDEPGWIRAFYHGYAVPTNGPIPVEPPNSFADHAAHVSPYPFSISAAANLLRSHGWKVVRGGGTYCARPGTGPKDCGAGIPKGRKLVINLDYATGSQPLADSMEDLKSQASAVGITLQLTTRPFNQVIARLAGCPHAGGSGCGWTIEDWGTGSTYSGYPTGESLWASTAAQDFSGYDSAEANRLIARTTTAPPSQAQQALDTYQNYIAKQLPGFWQPLAASNHGEGLLAVSDRLGGFTPNAYAFLRPEQWYFKKG